MLLFFQHVNDGQKNTTVQHRKKTVISKLLRKCAILEIWHQISISSPTIHDVLLDNEYCTCSHPPAHSDKDHKVTLSLVQYSMWWEKNNLVSIQMSALTLSLVSHYALCCFKINMIENLVLMSYQQLHFFVSYQATWAAQPLAFVTRCTLSQSFLKQIFTPSKANVKSEDRGGEGVGKTSGMVIGFFGASKSGRFQSRFLTVY